MKKLLILAFAAISLSSIDAVAFNTIAVSNTLIENSNASIGNGIITEITPNGGKLIDNISGETVEFEHPGAQVIFVVGDSVTYILIDRPKGKPPVVIEVKKPS